ncbi:DUF2920 family protein [Campylobacter insulaenigrae]|uniref:DUF2920 domain protein n=2 Tax=Campylobacter insulaenigrae TaxID=260714 RepID=A0A0A8H0W1_9BACT|nr:DUF2920 family protein [Campylobacter insulaenigrae]AJC87823.1 hypothetical protein (DUF2920 domain) [Campylobacter insulaenigrae NCTC 12927]MCR6593549.1 DUF2920 family protein [Campylobacter insulaenigrae]VEH94196.1 motility accessory factor [Campylobacter insulaenigrae]VEJ53896.1 motility accessory factor [Campylobacter insulaenigrae]
MLINKTYFIDSCDDVELNIKRESKLEFRLTYDDEKEIEAVVCMIAGGAADMNSYLYVDDYCAKQYKVAVINVNYHCIGNRPQLGCDVGLDDIDKLILETNLKAINLNIPYNIYNITSFDEMNEVFLYIDNLLTYLKNESKIQQNYKLPAHVSYKPTKNEYQNFGIMQATDILNALLYINKNPPFKIMGGGMKNILIGDSYGGYLANLCAKITPWNIDVVIDNSSFINFFGDIWRLIGFGKEIDFTRYHGTYDNIIFKNIFLYLSDKTHWTSNKQSPRYFSPARKLIREILNKEHLKTQSLYPKPKYISYHSKIDNRSPYQNKELFYNLLTNMKFDTCLYGIDYKDVDGKFIKNLEHGMGIPMKLLIKKHLPDILKEKVKDKTCKKEISYKSDDLIYTFKEKDDKILLEVNKIS